MGRKVYAERFGGPEVLRIRTEQPVRIPGPGEVSVRTICAGLNPVDWKIFAGGAIAERFGVWPPFGNGNDFSGVIDAVGKDVSGWVPGDRVYGGARFHAQADQIIIGDLSTLNRMPPGLSHAQAAVLDIAGRTALAGVSALELGPDDTVLISAAAGGVGLIAAQLAGRTGARVLGTASPRNHALLRSLGAEPVDYRGDLHAAVRAAAPEGLTAVLDCQGEETLHLALALGVPPRRINSVADRAAAERLGAISIGRATLPTSAVTQVGDLLAAGELQLPITEYGLDDVVEAYHTLKAGHVRGKIVLRLSEEPTR